MMDFWHQRRFKTVPGERSEQFGDDRTTTVQKAKFHTALLARWPFEQRRPWQLEWPVFVEFWHVLSGL
jgi:hypothetical protein